jgi:hypothetical protein
MVDMERLVAITLLVASIVVIVGIILLLPGCQMPLR